MPAETTLTAIIPAKKSDLRVSVRHACAGVVGKATSATHRVGWRVRVDNVSTNGVGLVVNEAIPVGSILLLELEAEKRKRFPPVRMRVVHSTRRGRNGWAVGGEFLNPLNDDELEELLRRGRIH